MSLINNILPQQHLQKKPKTMYKYAALFVLLASALAVPAPESNLDCLQNEDDIFSCVAVKMVSAIDRAARSADVHIIDGITFVKDGPGELKKIKDSFRGKSKGNRRFLTTAFLESKKTEH